jgi:DNA-binding transcriptional LysR family regulator
MEFDNIETVKRAVEIENGIAIVPLASVDEETENESLYAVEIESVDMWRPIGLVQRRGEPSAAIRAFVSLLRKRDVL